MLQNKVGEQKLYRLLGHFSVVFLFSLTCLSASSFEDFKKSQVGSFSKFTQAKDEEFKNYLQEQWQEYKAIQQTPLYTKPKPKNIIKTNFKTIESVGPKISIKLPDKIVQEEALSQLELNGKDIEINFYGSLLGFNIDEQIKAANYYPQNQQGVNTFFDVIASSDYTYLVHEIQSQKKKLSLNDWGLYLLVSQIAGKVFTTIDNQELFKWFIFNKLGYYVKLGLVNRHIVLMYRSDKLIYSTPSYSFDGKKYYVLKKGLDSGEGSIYSFAQDYPGVDKTFDLSLSKLPNLLDERKLRELVFKYNSKEYKISYSYNKNLIDFMKTYPQADYGTFFNAPLDNSTYENIAVGLKPYIHGMQASRAINFVLHFVQNAFVYETDSEQFGYEKVMFAEETLYYAKSDCEDRAILFSTLVKKLFKIGVVGVKYKDHMSTALYIPMKGDSVKSNGKRFVLADPTYINANIGQSMPKYKAKRPEKFIEVHN